MLESVKYLCDFFFGPGCGWHFLGLCILCMLFGNKVFINSDTKKNHDAE